MAQDLNPRSLEHKAEIVNPLTKLYNTMCCKPYLRNNQICCCHEQIPLPTLWYNLFIIRYDKFCFSSSRGRYKTASVVHVLDKSRTGSFAMYRNLPLLKTAWQTSSWRVVSIPFAIYLYYVCCVYQRVGKFPFIHHPNYPWPNWITFLIYGLSNNLFSCREIYNIPKKVLTKKKYVPLMTHIFHVVMDVDLYDVAV